MTLRMYLQDEGFEFLIVADRWPHVVAPGQVGVNADLVYFAGYASICDSSSSGYGHADGRGWVVDGGAEAVS